MKTSVLLTTLGALAATAMTLSFAQDATPPSAPKNSPTATASGDDEMVPNLLLMNNPVEDVIGTYERLTGKRVIRDSNLAQSVNIKINVSSPLKKSEAVRLIESSLLLNGVAFIPGPDGSVKAINVTAGKSPRTEGVPLYANVSSFPPGDQIISYFMSLRYISAAEAATIFTQQLQAHTPYGVIVPVPNAQAIVITETSNVIRQFVNLQKLIDVPPAKIMSEFVPLRRADAERVADTMTKMLEARRNSQTALGQAPSPSPDFGDDNTGPTERNIVAGTVQLIPDARTNRILVITRPVNFTYIKNLILQFDEAASITAPFERSLKYVAAGEVLPVLQKALAETKEDLQTSPGQANQQQQNQNRARSNTSSTSASNVTDTIQNPTDDTIPDSLIVGKTKLIADKRANSILVIGPPESVARAGEILNKLDTAPRQVYLATVIGELTLTNDSEFGVDLLQKWSGGSDHSSGVAAQSAGSSTLSTLNPRSLTSAAAFPGTTGLTVYGAVGSTLNYYVRALKSTSRFKILSRPSVYTSNNKRALISSGQQVPVPGTTESTLTTGTTNNNTVTSTVEYKDVQLELVVVPLINSDNEVTLQIAQQNNTLGTTSNIGGNEVPAINTQQFTTSITVPNRQTVVLGGLIVGSSRDTVTGVPWLSDIPVLGYLFKDTTKEIERREILILIEPNVIGTLDELTAASQREKERSMIGAEAAMMNNTQGIFVPSNEFPKLKPTKQIETKTIKAPEKKPEPVKTEVPVEGAEIAP